jgi:hypothetical protein
MIEPRFGKMPTTSVRRLISLFSRSQVILSFRVSRDCEALAA